MQLDFHHGLLEALIPNPRPPSVRADRVWQPANIVGMLKVELHAHTADDPEDFVPHTVERLVDRGPSWATMPSPSRCTTGSWMSSRIASMPGPAISC